MVRFRMLTFMDCCDRSGRMSRGVRAELCSGVVSFRRAVKIMIVLLGAIPWQLGPFFQRNLRTQLLKDFADWPSSRVSRRSLLLLQERFDQSQNFLLLTVRKRLKL